MMRTELFTLIMLLSQLSLPVTAAPRKDISLALGVPLQPSSSLVHIAIKENLFRDLENIEFNINYFVSGQKALDSIQKDTSLDIVFAADIAFLSNAHSLTDYRIVAHIFESDNVNRIVSLKKNTKPLGEGILCTQQNSAIHFFGSMVLERLNFHDTKIQFYPLDKLVVALGQGDCDAVTLRSPYIDDANDLYEIDIFEMPGAYIQREVIIVHNSVSDQTVKALLQSLIKAEEMIRMDTVKASETIAASINGNAEEILEVLQKSVLRVELKQMILPMMDLQISWLKTNQNQKITELQSIQLLRDTPIKHSFPARSSVVRYD